VAASYDPTTPVGQVRLLLNDVDEDSFVFDDEEIGAFLTLEGGNVKRAAAQAIDTNASNELLASKVLRTQDLQTFGDKLATALRGHAQSLREQAASEDSWFTIVSPPARPECLPEMTERYVGPRHWWQ